MPETGFNKLIVYQKSKQYVLLVYSTTKIYPSHELHELVSQFRRAAISIPANIVEGYSKSSTKDFIRYLDISLGSLAETEFYLDISQDLKYLYQTNYNKLSELALEIRKLLRSFQKSLRFKV